jgi:hypothetical protein
MPGAGARAARGLRHGLGAKRICIAVNAANTRAWHNKQWRRWSDDYDQGTGSTPAVPSGWHRPSRRSAGRVPRQRAVSRAMASHAYSEQEG